MTAPAVAIRGSSQRLTSLLWILVSVMGAVAGALVAWRIRALVGSGAASVAELLRYAATIVDAIILSTAQWLLLRRYRLEVYWWVPASVTATLVNTFVIVPSVLALFIARGATGPISPNTVAVAGAAALAAAGLVVGFAQALVLRISAGSTALAWIPATMVGGALAGALTTAISAQLFGLSAVVAISVVAAVGSLLTAASQVPSLLRLVR